MAHSITYRIKNIKTKRMKDRKRASEINEGA